MPETALDFLRPGPLPPGARAAVTTRAGGVSTGRYASLNLGSHVGDDSTHVAENRKRVMRTLELPAEPCWLTQVHGTNVIRLGGETTSTAPMADAAVTREPGVVLAVLTADCLPVLLAARDGSAVGVIHAGWRGLAGGVIEIALAAMDTPADELLAWLGPAIGAPNYEVGTVVRDALADSPGVETAFRPSGRSDHWHCNLAELARARLAAAGLSRMSGGAWDTFAEPARFYSYRRDGETGRMASLIWLTP